MMIADPIFGATANDLREAIWVAHVYPHCGEKPETPEERQHALLKALAHYRAAAAALETDPIAIARNFRAAKEVWNLLAHEAVGWLLPTASSHPMWIPVEEDHSDAISKRMTISHLLDSSQNDYVGETLDPVAVLIPRWIMREICRGLDALNLGEVMPLLKPAKTRAHQGASRLEARLRALEHIYFLVGQGVKLTTARDRVAEMTKIAVGTLRDWKSEAQHDPIACWRLVTAENAGRLKVTLESNPDYGKGPGETIDMHSLQCFGELQAEPLMAFARRFRREFGGRHWSS